MSQPPISAQFDLAVVGAGILGPASALAAGAALKERLGREQPARLARASLSVAQNAVWHLVVGDSHHYAVNPDPFATEEMHPYAYSPDQPLLVDVPQPGVRLAIVTSGGGAASGFAVGEELIARLLA